jgi:transposase InsO family protein
MDQALATRISELCRQNPRYGYRRVWALLRREGWAVNKKRVRRIWREAGLKVPQKQHKSRRLAGGGENGVTKRRAEYPDHVWSYDFAMDGTEDGRRVKVMPVVDEHTRECLSLEGQSSIKAEGVMDTLRRLFIERGAPDYIRSDNGPEFIAEALKAWLASLGVNTLYIEPGSPWENAYSETFVSRLRDELLERELFINLRETQVLLEDYRVHYNQSRPHGALSYLTPSEFAALEAQPGHNSGPYEQLEFVQRLSS